MSKKSGTNFNTNTKYGLEKVTTKKGITEYLLPQNGLRVLFVRRPGTGVITSDIVYRVGSRDEAVGETGIAHMFEHMLFKPTHYDRKRSTDSAIMFMERETGASINANTWKDRTSYYISYPKEHFNRALQIEAERMHGLILTDEEFKPEQKNVLSEFDMYAGDEQFALSVQMMGVAFQSHPYGHETIGYREDIEAYTIEKLKTFYEKFYAPNNATLIIVGDISETDMKAGVLKHFGSLKPSTTLGSRLVVTEPKQEGTRTVIVVRPSTTQVYALGVKHDAFPTKSWFETMVIFDMLAGGADSILHKKLVDTGLATNVHTVLEPTYEKNLGIIFVTLTKKSNHEKMHTQLHNIIESLTPTLVQPYLTKTIAKVLTQEFATRENSLGYASELVEYVSAGAWEHFFDSEKILTSITPKDIVNRIKILFNEPETTIGYFRGSK